MERFIWIWWPFIAWRGSSLLLLSHYQNHDVPNNWNGLKWCFNKKQVMFQNQMMNWANDESKIKWLSKQSEQRRADCSHCEGFPAGSPVTSLILSQPQTAPPTTTKPHRKPPSTANRATACPTQLITVSSFPFFHSHSRFGKHACQWLLIHVLSFVAGKYMMGSRPFKNPSPFFISRTDPANVASLKWLTICIRKLASRCNDRGHRDSQPQVIMNKINQRCFPDSVLKIHWSTDLLADHGMDHWVQVDKLRFSGRPQEYIIFIYESIPFRFNFAGE